MDKIRNEQVRGTDQVEQLGDKVREAKSEIDWTCANKGQWIYWMKDAENGESTQIHGCGQEGHADGWCHRGGCLALGEMEAGDLLQ